MPSHAVAIAPASERVVTSERITQEAPRKNSRGTGIWTALGTSRGISQGPYGGQLDKYVPADFKAKCWLVAKDPRAAASLALLGVDMCFDFVFKGREYSGGHAWPHGKSTCTPPGS